MFCLLSGCTLKKIYYPAYTGYDAFGRPSTVYDYYYVDIDDPKNAKYRDDRGDIIIQETPEKNSGCGCKWCWLHS